MGGGGSVAHSRMHARDQTIATSRCHRVRVAKGKRAHCLSFYWRGLWIERISMESHAARGCGGPTGAATGEADSHSSADVRFRRPTRTDRAKDFPWRRRKRKALGVASRDDNAHFTYSRLHRTVR